MNTNKSLKVGDLVKVRSHEGYLLIKGVPGWLKGQWVTVVELGARSSVTVQPDDGKNPVKLSVNKLDLTTIKAAPVEGETTPAPTPSLVPGYKTVIEAMQISDPVERAAWGQKFLDQARDEGDLTAMRLITGWFGLKVELEEAKAREQK